MAVEEAGDADQGGYRRLLEQLEARLLAEGKVTLRTGGKDVVYAGTFPLILGRESICHVVLRDAGISRRHSEVVLAGGKFALRDLHSKNGTTLGGVAIAPGGTLPLDGDGDLGVGEHCGMRFCARADVLELEVTRGLDRGLRILAGAKPFTIAGVTELGFTAGRPRLSVRDGRALHLNGVHAGGGVQLLRGDVVEVGDVKIEVL